MNENIDYYISKIREIIDNNLEINNFNNKRLNTIFDNFYKIKNISVKEIIDDATHYLKNQNLFIELDNISYNKNIYFIGDIHGDLITLIKIFINFFNNESIFVFLGDYVDRGLYSFEVFIFLTIIKTIFPSYIYLIAGNHEIFNLISFYPSDFWNSKNYILYKNEVSNFFDSLSLAGKIGNIIFLHGIPYPFNSIEDFKETLNKFEKISELFLYNKNIIKHVLWGDIEPENFILTFKRSDFVYNYEKFVQIKNKLKFDYLIRAHQPDVKGFNFNKKCITLITSDYYNFAGKFNGKIILKIQSKENLNFSLEENNIIFIE